MLRRWRHIFEAEFTILTLCLLYYLQYINSNCNMPNQPEQGRTVARKFICSHGRAGCICQEIHNIPRGFRWPGNGDQTELNKTITTH